MPLERILMLMFAAVVVTLLVIILVVVLSKAKNIQQKKLHAEKHALAMKPELEQEKTQNNLLNEPTPPTPNTTANVSKTDIKKEVPTTKTPAKYHVSQNKDENSKHYKKWRVRKQGSQKTIQYFNTQKEAIKFAESLSEKAGAGLVIHKKSGEIRKQNYNK